MAIKSSKYKKVLTKKLSSTVILLILLALGVFAVVFNRFYLSPRAMMIGEGAGGGNTSSNYLRCTTSKVCVRAYGANYECSNFRCTKKKVAPKPPTVTVAKRVACELQKCTGGVRYKNPNTGVWSSCLIDFCEPFSIRKCSNDDGNNICLPSPDVASICSNVGRWGTDCAQGSMMGESDGKTIVNQVDPAFSSLICTNHSECQKASGKVYEYCDTNFNRCAYILYDKVCGDKGESFCNTSVSISGTNFDCVWNSTKGVCELYH